MSAGMFFALLLAGISNATSYKTPDSGVDQEHLNRLGPRAVTFLEARLFDQELERYHAGAAFALSQLGENIEHRRRVVAILVRYLDERVSRGIGNSSIELAGCQAQYGIGQYGRLQDLDHLERWARLKLPETNGEVNVLKRCAIWALSRSLYPRAEMILISLLSQTSGARDWRLRWHIGQGLRDRRKLGYYLFVFQNKKTGQSLREQKLRALENMADHLCGVGPDGKSTARMIDCGVIEVATDRRAKITVLLGTGLLLASLRFRKHWAATDSS